MNSVAEKMRLSEPTTKTWMNTDPQYQHQECRPITLSFWRYKICANIRGGSPGRWRQTTVWLSTTAIFFCVFDGYFFGYFRDEASVIIWRYAVRRLFQWSQNAWPLMTLTVALNTIFAPVWLAETVRLRKIISWKLKMDSHCQQCKSSAGTLVSGDIRFARIFGRVL